MNCPPSSFGERALVSRPKSVASRGLPRSDDFLARARRSNQFLGEVSSESPRQSHLVPRVLPLTSMRGNSMGIDVGME